MINISRLSKRIEQLSEIGRTADDGVTRFSYTNEESKANELVRSYMEKAGLETSYDTVGNLVGTKKGKEGYPTILLGSHIDTVPNGGKYDGALGVLSAIEVLQSMEEHQVELHHTIKIYAFKDEEGSRFGIGMLGSRAVAGTLTSQMLEATDSNGISIKEAMQNAGYRSQQIENAKLDDVKLYLELHIEQGKILESHDVGVGVVTGIAGPLWLRVKVEGLAEHAGATPMNQRKDSLTGASHMILQIEELAKKYPEAVATVGSIKVLPNGTNVIPGYTEFTIDIRHVQENMRDQLEQDIKKTIETIATDRELTYNIEVLQRVSPAPCSEEIQTAIKSSIEELGVPTVALPSGAGHDGMQFKDTWPIGMIFVRSKDGLSHNPREFSSEEDVVLGTEVLYRTLLKLDRSH
ncbi:Zn-dependent hydrolase [Niallia sp. Krafla_26]|uniref:Zn-dependent hydrolase n=1 Tax=Niallia sp. Krafla_26 TaxID=3064703 RepID=UPI003D16F660